jgi:hypothetical protein
MKTMLCVCLGILAFSAPASAQQKQECFTVVMTSNPNTTIGSILIDRCTGNTWLLLQTKLANGATANRWYPIAVEKSEAITSVPPSVR